MAFDYANYYELDYIQSSGTQYINTTVKPSDHSKLLKIEADMQYVEKPTGSTSQFLFGTGHYASSDSNKRTITVGYRQGTSETKVAYNNGTALANCVAFTNSTLDANRHVYGIDQVNKNYIFDSETQSFTDIAMTSMTNPILIFATRSTSSGEAINYHSSAKLYRFKIWSDGALIADFVPARKKSDSTLGVYETVGGTFLTNSGTGDFIQGNIVPAINVKVNGAWKRGTPYVKVSGEWKKGKVFTKVSGTWKEGI